MARDPRSRRTPPRTPARREPSTPPGDEALAIPTDLIATRSPREILAWLVDGDPLRIEERVTGRLADLALLVDAERLFLRSTARAAFAAARWRGDGELGAWLDLQIERAAKDLLDEDRAAERLGPVADPAEARYAFLADTLGIEAAVARRACVVFNALPLRVRRVWWRAVVERRSLEQCVSEGLGPARQVRADLERALLALSRLEDPGGGPKEGR